MLLECGQAEAWNVDDGIFIASPDAVRLDKDTRENFSLPPSWPGGMRLQTNSVPQLNGFHAHLGLVYPGSTLFWDWRLRGPVLEAGGSQYLPTAAQYTALKAYQDWINASQKDEFTNLCLLAALREAKDAGLHIDLEAYQETQVVTADDIYLDAREDLSSGDLILRPVLTGSFPDIDPDQIEERLAQFEPNMQHSILRVGSTIVLLPPKLAVQAQAVASRGRVPKIKRKEFERNPEKWLAENVFPDVETEFSPRVTGIGIWKGGYLYAEWDDGQDWFGKQPSLEQSPEIKKTKVSAGDIEEKTDQLSDIDSDIKTDLPPVVPLIIPNDTELEFGWRFPELAKENANPFQIDFTRYAMTPLPHQEEAVRWLLGHAQRALARQTPTEKKGYGAGALLADDMGLGKTFSSLIFIAEWFDFWRKTADCEPPALLIVAPLSLLENWKAEIQKCFQIGHRVFTRILVAQADGDLAQVRRGPGSRDVALPGTVVEYGLGFGDGTKKSIDFPGGCVLTTYQTLRDYRFSFAKAAWSAAIFDEAQNIKNPNALQTISAKALKALFRLTLTGTPIENHLGDLWSIIDTAEPGPLGSFQEFKKTWIVPMARQRDQMADIGKKLREQVNGLMLRRLKEDQLKGLPGKKGDKEPILIDMTPEQMALYKSIIASVKSIKNYEDENENKNQNRYLSALWSLRQVSLHPDLLAGGNIKAAASSSGARAALVRSGKIKWLLNQLDMIKNLEEKVLIFCVQKKLQEALAHNLGKIYGLSIPVINGDTKSTSRQKPETTRLGLIEQFSNMSGFAVCILSPIAAGAGLNITAANHVIHLERHWNPAKEDQATDRVYRIGQKRPVTVYLPACTCPDITSFDLALFRLIDKKRCLQSALALVPPDAVTAPELMDELFSKSQGQPEEPDNVCLSDALQFSWRLFEALIAVIYGKDAERFILTPGGSDHGCDVIVIGWGADKKNLLIQCKSTTQNQLNSEVSIREVEGARPFYEQALGITFNEKCVHTTAKKVSRRTQRAGEICGVNIHCRSWLAEMLSNKKIKKSEIIAANSNRKKI